MKGNMKLVRKIIICTVIICLSACSPESEDVIIGNSIFPMVLSEDESGLVKLIEGKDPIALLNTSLDGSFRHLRMFVETYEDGQLLGSKDGLTMDLEEGLNLSFSITNEDFTKWNINAGSGNSVHSTQLEVDEIIDVEDLDYVYCMLNYEVELKANQPQMIGIVYFDDSESMYWRAGDFAYNEIENMWHYKNLYVLKVVFETSPKFSLNEY